MKCTHCGQRAQEGITICRACEKRARQELGNMAAYEDELLQGRPGVVAYGRSADTPMPYDVAASEILHQLRNILVSWAKLLHDELTGTWPRRDTVRAISLHLEAHMGELRRHEAAGEFVAEILDLAASVLQVIDHTPDRSRIPLGRQCPEPAEHGPCGGQMWMCVPWAGEGRQRVECEQCAMVWQPEQFRRLGVQLGVRVPMDPAGAQRLGQAISG